MNISKKTVSLPLVIVLLVLVGAASFFGGTLTNKGRGRFTPGQQMGLRQGNKNVNGVATKRANGFQMINGEITAADDSSLTVKTKDGSSQIVLLSSSTTYKKMADGAKTDLVTGKNVTITGTKDTSGSISATQISTGIEVPAGGPQGEIPQGNGQIPVPQN